LAEVTIDVNARVSALLALALGHRPDTVKGNLAVQQFLSNIIAELPPDAGGRNAKITDLIIDFLIRPDVAAEYRRWRVERKKYRPGLPTIEPEPVLTEKQKAKRRRNEIYAERRATKEAAKWAAAAERAEIWLAGQGQGS
jgi:hypothetical protein